jgi:hypothetical protein
VRADAVVLKREEKPPEHVFSGRVAKLWRQDAGGSPIEASKIADHSKVATTLGYMVIGMKCHDTLTRYPADA